MTCLELSREFSLSADSKERCRSVYKDDKKSSAWTADAVESVSGLAGNSTARRRLFHRKLGKDVKRARI